MEPKIIYDEPELNYALMEEDDEPDDPDTETFAPVPFRDPWEEFDPSEDDLYNDDDYDYEDYDDFDETSLFEED
jgi:hypothetical protein